MERDMPGSLRYRFTANPIRTDLDMEIIACEDFGESVRQEAAPYFLSPAAGEVIEVKCTLPGGPEGFQGLNAERHVYLSFPAESFEIVGETNGPGLASEESEEDDGMLTAVSDGFVTSRKAAPGDHSFVWFLRRTNCEMAAGSQIKCWSGSIDSDDPRSEHIVPAKFGDHEVTPPAVGGAACNQEIITSDRVNLRLDSDNDGDRDADDERIEDDPGEMGQIVGINTGDRDRDGVPDFADGFNRFGGDGERDVADDRLESAGGVFCGMRVEIEGGGIDPAKARVRFLYEGSDPADVERTENQEGAYDYGLAEGAGGRLRLWLAGAGAQREGKYITPEEPIPYGSLQTTGEDPRHRIVYVEGVRLGRAPIAVEVDPDGDGKADFEQTDALWVRVLGVQITQAPDYLFANARYATPIRFEIQGAGAHATFDKIEPVLNSVKVSFYAAHGDGGRQVQHRFTTANLAGSGQGGGGRISRVVDTEKGVSLKLLGTDAQSDKQRNCYEAYVKSTAYRTGDCDLIPDNPDPNKEYTHFTPHAHFELEAGLGSGAMAKAVYSLTRFGDRAIAAFDILDDEQTDYFWSKLAYTQRLPGYMYTELVSFPELPLHEDSASEDYHGKWVAAWSSMNSEVSIETEARGVVEVNSSQGPIPVTFADEFAYSAPWWWVSYAGAGEYKYRSSPRHGDRSFNVTGLPHNAEVCPGALTGAATDTLSADFQSRIGVGPSGYPGYNCKVRMDNKMRSAPLGVYAGKNTGNRFGGYIVASYGRIDLDEKTKDPDPPPCLEGTKIEVPWSEEKVQEDAMDLSKRTASVGMQVKGALTMNAQGHSKQGGEMPLVDLALAPVASVLTVANPHSALFTVPAMALLKWGIGNSVDDTGQSMASFRVYYQRRDENGALKDARPFHLLSFSEKLTNNEEDYTEPEHHFEIRDIDLSVGEQFSLWADLSVQGQLRGTWILGTTGHCSASAFYEPTILKDVSGSKNTLQRVRDFAQTKVMVYER
jgi:hypothetical protein